MIDLSNPEAVRAEAARRQRLREQGSTTFEPSVIGHANGQRIIDEAEIGKIEKEIEHQCDRLVLALGGWVKRFSHPGKTKQTPGIADRLYGFPWLKLAVWWEAKAPGGKQRPDQVVFQEDVIQCGHEYGLGGLGDFKAWLVAHGVAAGFNDDGTPIPIPR